LEMVHSHSGDEAVEKYNVDLSNYLVT
jgi:hypothetical protein